MQKRHQLFQFKGQTLTLFAQRALYWVEKSMLIVSDVHAGKSGHFRKHGIAVPRSVNDMNFSRLESLIQETDPESILFLGDLFHSENNMEINDFRQWRVQHEQVEMLLTMGNHDVLYPHLYDDMNIACVDHYRIDPFVFLHDPDDRKNLRGTLYPIAGHIHPSVKLTGKGRQSIRVPCFYFGQDFALLPAFGTFTGNHRIKSAPGEKVFALVEEQILDLGAEI